MLNVEITMRPARGGVEICAFEASSVAVAMQVAAEALADRQDLRSVVVEIGPITDQSATDAEVDGATLEAEAPADGEI
jgi:hypothetical protein